MKPFDAVDNDRDAHVRLHVRRMFITDKADLLPHWLRFVSGVVDTEDLPLNVSREMLQTTPVLARIRKALIGRVLSELKTRAKEAEDYNKFWENFGPIMKEGVWEDAEHRTEIAPLLRFRSSAQDGWTSLPDYVSRMKEGQDTIYYLSGDHADALKSSPQLEGFRAQGLEVLLMSDSIDAFWPERLDSFEGKKLRSVTQAAADIGKGEDQPDISAAAGGDEDGAGRPGFRRPRHRAADRQRGGAGLGRQGPGSADAAADAPGRTGDDAGEAGAGGQSEAPADRDPGGKAGRYGSDRGSGGDAAGSGAGAGGRPAG